MHETDQDDDLISFSDIELVRLCKNGSEDAFRKLADRFFLTMKKKASGLAIHGTETEDLMQEGLIALHQAVLSFDENDKASFRTYADVCIRNRMISAVRHEMTQKNKANTAAASIEEADTVPSSPDSDPQNAIISKESLRQLEDYLKDHLTKTETNVLNCYLEGLTYDEIAGKLSISRKSCDNAMQRVRRKLRERY